MREVFAHWQRVMASPRSVLDGKRERVIRAAIARHGVEDCKRAIDGCAADPWSMGRNDRHTKFNSIELILRDAAHVERFLAIAPKPKPPTPPVDAAAYVPPRPIRWPLDAADDGDPPMLDDAFTSLNLMRGNHG